MKAVHAQVPLAEAGPQLQAGHELVLQRGGDELFAAMCAAMAQARHEVWLATYIFHHDASARAVAEALAAAARRGVQVRVVVDGFGSKASLPHLREWLSDAGVQLVVFRPLNRWWRYLQPSQLRRLHQKLCVVDASQAFVGGINVVDDRVDLHHGLSPQPRLDYAVALRGPAVAAVQRHTAAVWQRAQLGQAWRGELRQLARAANPVDDAVRLLRGLRSAAPASHAAGAPQTPEGVRAALVVRDNFRQRRAIERAYIEAIRRSRAQVDIACPYFYPGRAFRRALLGAARRGVQVRLLLQGKVDYQIAALAARVHYEDLLSHGVRVFEYTPAFLHAKVAVVDDEWATVGSSNIDPLSLLLNLEANLVVMDAGFAAGLRHELDAAFATATEVKSQVAGNAWRGWLGRGFARGLIAWMAHTYLRIAGVNQRY
jgi:cardiolipin synthase